MQRSRSEAVDVLIVLMSLVAEGTPQLALQLARQWQLEGLSVEVRTAKAPDWAAHTWFASVRAI